MKNKILLLLVYSTFSSSILGQDISLKKRDNYFYVGPLDLFLNTIQLGYERKLGNYNTIFFSGGFKLSEKDDMINRIGGNGELQYRINLLYNKETVNPVLTHYSTFAYFAPFVQYRNEKITDLIQGDILVNKNEITIVNSGFAGLGFGFRFTAMQNRFCMNVYAGGGLKYSQVTGNKKYTNFIEVGYTGVAPKVSFEIGIAF